jgi:hypothetical protein
VCVELHTKSAVEELSAKVAEQQLLLQAPLKAKLEAEAAAASVKAKCETQRSDKISGSKISLQKYKPTG